ncbi:hypothetical protein FNV43_RR14798 [Rhamnella rubrinervis]|uniref:Uncharacterized protein n=1 Tax=Rhamnella rubrinervis TaxID=2594499 RepID=A0A8K0H3N2_9ROSA|nr:hypothetical protein FNV43_RR14798 [Rhamnella rubrinervis]
MARNCPQLYLAHPGQSRSQWIHHRHPHLCSTQRLAKHTVRTFVDLLKGHSLKDDLIMLGHQTFHYRGHPVGVHADSGAFFKSQASLRGLRGHALICCWGAR